MALRWWTTTLPCAPAQLSCNALQEEKDFWCTSPSSASGLTPILMNCLILWWSTCCYEVLIWHQIDSELGHYILQLSRHDQMGLQIAWGKRLHELPTYRHSQDHHTFPATHIFSLPILPHKSPLGWHHSVASFLFWAAQLQLMWLSSLPYIKPVLTTASSVALCFWNPQCFSSVWKKYRGRRSIHKSSSNRAYSLQQLLTWSIDGMLETLSWGTQDVLNFWMQASFWTCGQELLVAQTSQVWHRQPSLSLVHNSLGNNQPSSCMPGGVFC